jgi:hypothetical protein
MPARSVCVCVIMLAHELEDLIYIYNVISLKGAEGRNPSIQEIYKSVPKRRKQKSKKLKTLQRNTTRAMMSRNPYK